MERTTKSNDRAGTVVLAGMVLDILTNQPVPDVHVYQLNDDGALVAGMVTDAAGVYVLDLSPDYPLRLSHVSYEAETADVGDGGEVVHYLVPAAYDLPEVEIFGEGPDRPTTTKEPGVRYAGLAGMLAALAWAMYERIR